MRALLTKYQNGVSFCSIDKLSHRKRKQKTMSELKKLIQQSVKEGHWETQGEIAEHLEIGQDQFSRMLNNTKRKLTIEQILRLRQVLQLGLEEIIEVLHADETGVAFTLSVEHIEHTEKESRKLVTEMSQMKTRLNQLEKILFSLETQLSEKSDEVLDVRE